jgi:ferredoxin-NADP reductase
VTDNVSSFRFEKPEEFTYLAGQWFKITVPSSDGPLSKPFTYSSSPTEPYLQLSTRLSGSDFKNALAALAPGDEVQMEGVFGNFTLKDDLERLAFLAGGIGVTPIRSILRYMADTGASLPVTVFYGNMTIDDIPFKQDFDEFEATLPALKVVHVIFDPPEDWKGPRGYITGDVVREELDDPTAWTYYVSGPPPMIDAMRKVTDSLGVPKERLVVESFGAAK